MVVILYPFATAAPGTDIPPILWPHTPVRRQSAVARAGCKVAPPSLAVASARRMSLYSDSHAPPDV
jgi:hypothetical protein